MRTLFLVSLVASLSCAGCGGKQVQSASPTPAPKSTTALPSLAAAPSPTPPPSAAAVPATPVRAPAAPDVPTFEGANEAEKLTWALRAFYDDPNRPAIKDFEPLVKARILRSVPVPPPGKKYVIDMKTVEVRLENQ